MRKPNNGYHAVASQRFDGIILQVKKTHTVQRFMIVFTLQRGWLRVFFRKGRRNFNQGIGGLFVFNTLTFDAWKQNDVLMLGEYEASSHTAAPFLTLEGYAYAQIFVEIVLHLVPEGEKDTGVYGLLCHYGSMISKKNERILTVIAGWQLVAAAGFCPDVDTVLVYRSGFDDNGKSLYYLAAEPQEFMHLVSVSRSERALWNTFLSYDWQAGHVLQISRRGMILLEELLYSYVRQCTDRPLRSVSLLDDIGAIK